MTKKQASDIFNVVLGPVMIGPSSSHTAGPARIGQMVYDLCGGGIRWAKIFYSKSGSYAATLKGQASDRGFTAGLLGWGCADPRIPEALKIAKSEGIDIQFQALDETLDHPNRAILIAAGHDGAEFKVHSLSLGGGMVLITAINDIPVEVNGSDTIFVEIEPTISIHSQAVSPASRKIRAVLPVKIKMEYEAPFINSNQILQIGPSERSFSDFALDYEMALSGWSAQKIDDYVEILLSTMEESVRQGMKIRQSSYFQYLSPSAHLLEKNRSRTVDVGLLNESIIIATAIMEHDRNMGVIVAAPTAGSAGVLPATLIPMLKNGGIARPKVRKGLLAAGLVGAIISNEATFAAEEAGCQAENGAASAMAAAAICEMMGGDTKTALMSASLALSNLLGLICDPVAGSVEVPCISRNSTAVANAFISANMVLAGFDPFIPFDEVVQAMLKIGQKMPVEFRCTAQGGLASTPTACRICGSKIQES